MSSLPLLIHTKYLAFEWGKSTVDYFRKYAAKHGLDLFVFHEPEVIDIVQCQGYVIVSGVDLLWLKHVVTELEPLKLQIVLLNGELWNYRENISHIIFDQKSLLRNSLEVLHRHNRTNTAFFGALKHDTSDAVKENYFADCFQWDDIYSITDSIEDCFAQFWRKAAQYDSVICANDGIAVYFMQRCFANGLSIPEDLYLIGNGNLWLSSHVTPTISTAAYDRKSMTEVTAQICGLTTANTSISSIDVFMKATVIERASTGAFTDSVMMNNEYLYPYNPAEHGILSLDIPPEIHHIQTLSQIFSSCSSQQLEIYRQLVNGESYQTISDAVYITVDAVKYHVKKIYKLLDIHSRKELCTLLDHYRIVL